MATLKEIKNRINGIKSTQKITKAMKMVSAAKLKKAQDRIIATRPYANKMNEMLSHLAAVAGESFSPLMEDRPVNNKLVVIISADRGMCGSFNSNLIKFASNYIEKIGKESKILLIGKKANDFFGKRGYNIIDKHIHIFSTLNISFSKSVVDYIVKGFIAKEYDTVELIYNEFKSVVKQNIVQEQFLPIAKPEPTASDLLKNTDYIFEPSAKEILEELIPKQLNVQFWKALSESYAAELGARMTAMELATKNANDLIKSLDLIYNKARQESITKELLEIVSGAEALKEG